MAISYLRLAVDKESVTRGDVVPIQAIVTNTGGAVIASGVLASGITVNMHLHDPNWTIVASGVQMDNGGSNGLVYYDWDSAADSEEGWYTAVAFWQDGNLSRRIAQRLFRLDDHLI